MVGNSRCRTSDSFANRATTSRFCPSVSSRQAPRSYDFGRHCRERLEPRIRQIRSQVGVPRRWGASNACGPAQCRRILRPCPIPSPA